MDLDLNEEVRKAWKYAPGYVPRNIPDAIVLDTSAVMRKEGRRSIQSMIDQGSLAYLTVGAYDEILESTRTKEGERFDSEDQREALLLILGLKSRNKIINVDEIVCQIPTLEFEKEEVLPKLSTALSKTVLEDLVMEDFNELYEMLKELTAEVPRRDIKKGANDYVKRILYGDDQYGKEVMGYILRKEQELPRRFKIKLEELESTIPGRYNYRTHTNLRRSKGLDRNVKTFYYFGRLIRSIMVDAVRERTAEQARERYLEKAERNGGCVDQNILLAGYGIVPLMHPEFREVGIITADRDISELLVLRLACRIDYPNSR